ncbi:MFS transporter (plasmid) [Azospirillum brasilense]|uniref:MFS transporter n=1 Tax=Azospirillum brasilense TaxID=192 RepID=A0A4D8QQA1_AZOBR|nr:MULTISPECIES: MFS transporter [Azospirillum]MDW7554456.1 MFS transporter [Azospirillum brasilense]MDW7556329.1 MFS transporter [Azospirillum brasilense]MDW7594025.1 MFS transporter [Azospirillum brasilense]MDW7631703.1 MFS transporter [Azospirillum brasilense]MDX5950005.1 MFS transporter [Azospirillum brasilense]
MTKTILPAITPAAASGVAAGSLLPPAFLALGTFAIGTEGFMIAPLLPVMAAEFGMGLSSVAMLVVVFTLVLAVSSPIATVLTGRLRRRDTLLLAMALFTAGNLLAAVSPGFWTLMAARVLMAVAAGLYTPNANALAGAIVGPEKRGRALAIVSGGMTLAIALGLPLGALVGHAFGWRATFLAVAVMGVVAIGGITAGVRRGAGAGTTVASLGERLAVVRQAAVLRLLSVTLFWSVGAYTAYPFIAPYLDAVLGFGAAGIGATVAMWGAFAAIGVITGGTLNDRFGSNRVTRASLRLLGASFFVLAATAALGRSAALVPTLAAVAVWGFSVWSFFPAQMARLIAAGTAAQAPVALALNTSTMYLGFSLGSALGAGVVGSGAVWGIGVIAGLSELIALALNRHTVR